MTAKAFNDIVIKRLDKCLDTLCTKADEYATSDRLHNFKVAATIQNCTPITALGGMMCKHTVSVYDLIRDHEAGKNIPEELWAEKIRDSINYLLLLTALIAEDTDKKGRK
jgi:hypothetical protein